MGDLKAKVLKFEKLTKQIPMPIKSLTLRQLYALGVDRLFELIPRLSDKQLDWIINDGPEEEREWLESLSIEELEAVERGELLPPFYHQGA